MRAVYLLLRDNQETGPYTIDELLQQHLRPSDLIWVEGKSTAWAYSYEIEELKKALEKGIHSSAGVKSGKDEIEKKAEALRQRVLSYQPTYINWKKEDGVSHRNEDVLRLIEEEQIEFIDHSNRGATAYEVLAGIVVLILVSAGIYGGQVWYKNNKVLSMQTSQAIERGKEDVKQPVQPVKIITAPAVQAADTLQDIDSSQAWSQPATMVRKLSGPTEQATPPAALPETTAVAKEIPAVVEEPKKNPEPAPAKAEEKQVEKDTVATVVSEPQKKGLGQVLKGLFKKKKKKEAADSTARQ